MHVLQEEGADEEVREHPGEQQPARRGRAHERADGEDAQRDQRVAEPRLEEDEGDQQGDGGAFEAEGVGGGPAEIGRGHDPVDAEHQRSGDEHCPGDVDPMTQAQALVLADQPGAERHRRDTDRHVDEEDPVPAGPLRQGAARKQSEGAAARDHEREHAHRLGALGRLLELGDDDGDDHARRQRAPEALQEAARDQVVGARGEPAAHRGDGEQEHARQEDLAAPDQVAEPAGDQQEAPVGDEVGVDHPRQAGLRKTKVALHERQRHVDDGRVEHDHQLPQADDDQGRPTP